jgi:hypothetical protein
MIIAGVTSVRKSDSLMTVTFRNLPSDLNRSTAPFAFCNPKWQAATVGMAMNCACASLTAQGEWLDPEKVTQIASDLLRVAAWLEAGNLLPKRAAASDQDGGGVR